MIKLLKWLSDKVIHRLLYEEPPTGAPPCDYDRLSFEIRPCDVILVEGRSRVSEVIKTITHSPWTHSALYIGRLVDIEDASVREHVSWLHDGNPEDQLIIEPLLGEGTIVTPLAKYAKDHLRICRPMGLSRADSSKVVAYGVEHLGRDYDVRQMFDLARFLLPYGILPRRWRSSLFERNPGSSTRTVCSTMIAAAFSSVHFPVLPVIHRTKDGLRMFRRNTRLSTPRDFDHSPYFEIIKYPLLGLNDLAVYRNLPWDQDGVICNDENDCYIPSANEPQLAPVSNDEASTLSNTISTTALSEVKTENSPDDDDENKPSPQQVN